MAMQGMLSGTNRPISEDDLKVLVTTSCIIADELLEKLAEKWP